jgi:Tol biopolymer transport system component
MSNAFARSGCIVAENRSARWSTLLLVLAVTVAGCRGSTDPVRVEPLPTTFLFVKGAAGDGQVYRWFGDSTKAITTGPGENVEPSAAADRMAFTSYRDGNAEIYLANIDGTGQHRIVTSTSFDNQPDLSPDATKIVFVSTRTGAQRLYTADSSGGALALLQTGSLTNVPETAPAWSPDGQSIAFTSSRTGTSQVWIVPAAGGVATQLTHETIGAFDPSWSEHGDTVFFVASGANTQIRATQVATGATVTFPTAPAGYAQPACAVFGCLAVRGPYGAGDEIVVLQLNGKVITPIDLGGAPVRDPVLLR